MDDVERQKALFAVWQGFSKQDKIDHRDSHWWFCALCGIPFREFHDLLTKHPGYDRTHTDEHAWSSYHRTLRIPKVATAQYLDNEVCLTGIGQWSLRHSRIPPPGYDIRDLFKHRNIKRNSKSSLYFFMNGDEKKEWDSFEKPYALSFDIGAVDTEKSVYMMHPRCCDILLQQHALIAAPTAPPFNLNELAKIFLQIPLGFTHGGFAPDWAPDYDGPEPFFWCDSQNENLDDYPEWQFLLQDPGVGRGFDELFRSPPALSDNLTPPPIYFSDDGLDIFARLPVELLIKILVLLPTTSVRNLQLASRRTASVHLDCTYWRSRFEFPNELCHFTLPPASELGGDGIDWRSLCDQLLHPVGDGYGWWQNRKRITRLNKKLLESMSNRESDGRLKGAERIPLLENTYERYRNSLRSELRRGVEAVDPF